MLDKAIHILLSRKFAVELLVIMVVLLILGTSLPDISGMTPREAETLQAAKPLLFRISAALQLQSLIASPYFLILPLLIFLSTAACTARRSRSGARKEGGFLHEASGASDMGPEEIGALLASERWRVTRSGGSVTADKGSFGFWGSIVFHLGLLLIFVAVVISSLTQFNAELLLTEGFPVRLGRDTFVKIYKGNGLASLPPATVLLRKFTSEYENDVYEKDFAAHLLIDGKEREVHVNRPADIGDFQIALHRFGFAPSFRITDSTGKEILNATINLVLAGGQEDSFRIPGTPYEVQARFFPDFATEGKRIGSRTPVPNNPVFLLRVTEQGRETGEGLIGLNRTETIGGLTITFDGLNYWADMIVSRDYGLWFFAGSVFLIVLGLAVRFGLSDKQLVVTAGEGRISIRGWCKYYPMFFEDQVQRIIDKAAAGKYNSTS